MLLSDRITAIIRDAPQVRWGVSVSHGGESVVDIASDEVFATASMGKVFLLIAASRLIDAGSLDPTMTLTPRADERVADSGVWQFFPDQPLSVEALCALVSSVSDNTATNVLLRVIGLTAVEEVSRDLGVPQTLMVDRIRQTRTPADPDVPSRGRPADLARVMDHLARARTGAGADRDVASWLARNCDLSMAASAFDLDPLAHVDLADDRWFLNKTGTDRGVRADAGAFGRGRNHWSYCVLANWAGDDPDSVARVMEAMRSMGHAIRAAAAF